MKNLNIGLLGGSFCCPNLGVGALTISQCMILNNIAEELQIKFDIVCYESEITSLSYLKAEEFKYLNIVLDTHTYNVFKMKKKLDRHNIVIDMYGGDSFADIYSVKGFIIGASQRILSLNKSQLYIMAPQTIGPFKNKISYFFAKKVMDRAERIFIRDFESAEVVNENNKTKLESVTDMAFLLPFSESKNSEFQVGINVSGLLWDSMLLGNMRDEYRKTVCAIIEYFKSRDISVVLVPHVLSNGNSMDSDIAISRKITKEFNNIIKIAPEFKNPVEAKSFINGLSLFIGSRMHATIAAVSSGVPSLAIAYSKKFSGVFNVFGYKHIVESKNIEKNVIIKKIDSMLENYDSLKQELLGVSEITDKKLGLYINYLKEAVQNNLYENNK